jgi:heptosyltransferase-2
MKPKLPLLIWLALKLIDLFGKGLRRFLSVFSDFWKQGKPVGNPKRILIIHGMHLGDTLVATPALRALRKRFPDAYIVFWANKSGAQILKGNPDVNEVRVFSAVWLFSPVWLKPGVLPHCDPNPLRKLARLLAYYGHVSVSLIKEARNLRGEKFDMAIDFSGTIHHYILMVLAKIPVRVGPAGVGDWLLTHPVSLPDERTISEIERLLMFVRAVGADTDDKKPFVTVFPEAEASVTEKLRRKGISPDDFLVVIHPSCASAPASRWRPEAWAEVADFLVREHKAKVVFNGVESERQEIESIKAKMQEEATDLCGELTVQELVALLKRCDLFLTANSGPMHIAASLGTPMVVVQGAWNVIRWRPYGNNFRLVVKDVPCANCGHGICPLPVSCTDMITPEEVIAAIKEMLVEISRLNQRRCPSM